MNPFMSLLYILLCSESTLMADGHPKLTALNDSTHALQLYRELINEDAPSEKDPSTTDAQVRKRICEEITGSRGFFRRRNFVPVDPAPCFLRRPRYAHILHQIYTLRDSCTHFYEYTNQYEERNFKVDDDCQLHEHVFACTLLDSSNGDIVPFYVSKEYNVGPFDDLYMPGRFLIGSLSRNHSISYDNDVVLAETPAKAHQEPGFNVELYYLQIRKYVEPARNNAIDPLCRLVSRAGHDPRNQHYRLCVAVFSSSYFVYKVRYPHPGFSTCSKQKVSFKTTEGLKEAASELYFERMTLCYTSFLDFRQGFSSLYISRAYGSNRILVYRRDASGANVYLENLSVNVSIVDELNSFDFVEY